MRTLLPGLALGASSGGRQPVPAPPRGRPPITIDLTARPCRMILGHGRATRAAFDPNRRSLPGRMR
jgi:hypothetical protein